MKTNFFEKSSVHLVLLILVGLCVYSNTFHVPFVFDDQPSISANPIIRDLGNFFRSGVGYAPNPRRYIGYLTFALNYRLGGLDVTGYHVVNLAVHLCNALLLYCLILLTFRTPFLRLFAERFPVRGVALFAGLLFVVHPVETQAVTYIVQRLTSLMTLFYLLALVLYARMRLLGESSAQPAWWKSAGLYLLAFTSALLAMNTKENAFTLPVMLLLYEIFFFRGPFLRRALVVAPFLLTMLIIPLGMLNVHKPLGEVLSDVSQVTQLEAPLPRWGYLCTQFRVIITYLRLLVLPINQNLDYDYPLYHSLFDPPVFASFLFLLLLLGLAFYLLYKSSVRFQDLGFKLPKTSNLLPETSDLKPNTSNLKPAVFRLIVFGIFWFFITLSVESSFIPIIDVIYEHRLYLPSIGAFLAAATALVLLARRCLDESGRQAGLICAVAVIAVLGVATFRRNEVWNDSVTFWNDVVGKSPAKVRGYNNLGAALGDANRQEEAIAILRQALVIKPDHPEAYYNLGRIYLQRPGEHGTAITLLSRAIELNPAYDDAYVNLGAAYLRAAQPAQAIRSLDSVRPEAMNRPDRHFNLGVAYFNLGETDKAAREVTTLRELAPQMALQLEQYINQPAGDRGRPR